MAPSKTIQFRLPGERLADVAAAARREDVSAHELARRVLLDWVDGSVTGLSPERQTQYAALAKAAEVTVPEFVVMVLEAHAETIEAAVRGPHAVQTDNRKDRTLTEDERAAMRMKRELRQAVAAREGVAIGWVDEFGNVKPGAVLLRDRPVTD